VLESYFAGLSHIPSPRSQGGSLLPLLVACFCLFPPVQVVWVRGLFLPFTLGFLRGICAAAATATATAGSPGAGVGRNLFSFAPSEMAVLRGSCFA
jgi:hypothetical protein